MSDVIREFGRAPRSVSPQFACIVRQEQLFCVLFAPEPLGGFAQDSNSVQRCVVGHGVEPPDTMCVLAVHVMLIGRVRHVHITHSASLSLGVHGAWFLAEMSRALVSICLFGKGCQCERRSGCSLRLEWRMSVLFLFAGGCMSSLR